ncbi:MAG: hypothetical protein HOP35_00785 [Nitrospira sp.]|nr:hypothetical protein [Nitrospira sp.]
MRAKNITPHVAQNDTNRRSAIDGRTTRHPGYAKSQTCRKMIECIFGWGKQHGTMRKTKLRGTDNVAAHFMLDLIGYNLIRIQKLLPGNSWVRTHKYATIRRSTTGTRPQFHTQMS